MKSWTQKLSINIKCSLTFRYNCFLCDFDICLVCGRKQEEAGDSDSLQPQTELETVIDKMLGLREVREGEGGEEVTSLRTLCATVSSKELKRRNFGRNTIVLKETATNTEETVLCGPSEI